MNKGLPGSLDRLTVQYGGVDKVCVMGDVFDTTQTNPLVMNTNYESKHFVYKLEESCYYSNN